MNPKMPDPAQYDVIIIGGGPAGLSAALILGLSRRRVLVLDDNRPRNAAAPISHGFLTQDGKPPAEIAAAARRDLAAYSNVELLSETAVDARVDGKFIVVSASLGKAFRARKLIFASGLVDQLPPLPGLAECWGKSIFPCPYCHAFEFRDRPLAMLGNGYGISHIIAILRSWSADVVLLTNGPPTFDAGEWPRFSKNKIRVYDQPIAGFDHAAGMLTRVSFQNNTHLARTAILYHPRAAPSSDLPALLGLLVNGVLKIDPKTCRTSNPNIYAAGDLPGAHGAPILASAVFSGTSAGRQANEDLAEEDFAGG